MKGTRELCDERCVPRPRARHEAPDVRLDAAVDHIDAARLMQGGSPGPAGRSGPPTRRSAAEIHSLEDRARHDVHTGEHGCDLRCVRDRVGEG